MRLAMVLTALCLHAAVASAGSTAEEARAHFERGSALYDIGKYAEAAQEYEQAYTMRQLPELLYNIGQAYRQAGDAPAALRAYRSYLRRVPEAKNRALVESYITRLQHDVDNKPSGKAAGPPAPLPPAPVPAPTPTPTPPQPAMTAAIATPPPPAAEPA